MTFLVERAPEQQLEDGGYKLRLVPRVRAPVFLSPFLSRSVNFCIISFLFAED